MFVITPEKRGKALTYKSVVILTLQDILKITIIYTIIQTRFQDTQAIKHLGQFSSYMTFKAN